MKGKNTNGVYVADIDRFGYTLRAVGRSAEEAKAAVMEEYKRAYLDESGYPDGYDPAVNFDEDYNTAMDECYVRLLEFGKVEWE